ncbi:MAG: hypothetical protein H0X63_05305 [Flavobacteriales bacterium]|jgi:hypothetical protein|nr:hypothetical protein [Flavobacteriales bacterium]
MGDFIQINTLTSYILETKLPGFINIAYKEGFTDYEILICVFLKHFKFLQSYGNYAGYQLESYSWIAYEQQIKLYSAEYKISIVFFISGENLEVYFERHTFFSNDRWYFTDVMKSKNITDYPVKFNISTMDSIFTIYASLFKNNAELVLKRQLWK